jgi:hypothetical protein
LFISLFFISVFCDREVKTPKINWFAQVTYVVKDRVGI